ncbi:MAG TPA: alkyl sulfatase dimerization domain-containing protein [Patescibacteria group bacterium]|nr:alkyl sulfatase dimerization domain-containing protein [Patescibacteria group bacterium]
MVLLIGIGGLPGIVNAEPLKHGEALPGTASAKPATVQTADANNRIYQMLDFSDEQEKTFAEKGLIDAPDILELKDAEGRVVWSQKAYDFLHDNAPPTANPSLWRNAQLNHLYGLFEVQEGIYQVRGYDMANLTLVKSDNGWIVFDVLMSEECSRAAMQLVEKNLGRRPVKAVVISHPHVDHFGGIKGVMTEEEAADPSLSIQEQLASGKIPVIVPKDFETYAIGENIYAGAAMGRRAGYQYGTLIEKGKQGSLSIGIGMGQSLGTISYITPTYEVANTGEKITIDGIKMEFQMTPGTEAPVEMNTWFPQYRALWMAENCTGTLHNLYTLRGAQVRDGNDWAKFLLEATVRYGEEVQVVFQSHNWPHWGNQAIRSYFENTAAVYKYINDQTLRYINQGYTSDEISNMIALSEAMQKVWYTRPYYGTVAHNSKAVYQKYMGWYDANPVHLNPLTPSDRAKKFVEYLGDKNEVLRKAKRDFARGEYRWVAEITNVLVFENPANTEARNLCADALEQLGYQAESGTWRNVYLSGAYELRNGANKDTGKVASGSRNVQKNMSVRMMLDYLGILIDGQAAQSKDLRINLQVTDTGEKYFIHLYRGTLLCYRDTQDQNAVATLTCPRKAVFTLLTGDVDAMQKAIEVTGDRSVLQRLTENIVTLRPFFNIVEP